MGTKIFIIQSNYIPWKGYFDAINEADIVVLYDEMQYTKGDWRNRNLIKTPQGLKWLTIPIDGSGKTFKKINVTRVKNQDWAIQHWNIIRHNYSRAIHYKEQRHFLENLYRTAQKFELLSDINYFFLAEISAFLGISTPFIWSKELNLRGNKSEKLLNICLDLNADCYLTGPRASGYLDISMFTQNGIIVEWLEYSNYLPYKQVFGDFEHGVSIIDLILNQGENAPNYMKSFSK